MRPVGVGLGSRQLPLPRPGHRLAVLLTHTFVAQRSGVLVPHGDRSSSVALGQMPSEGFEPPTTGPKPVVISISPRGRGRSVYHW